MRRREAAVGPRRPSRRARAWPRARRGESARALRRRGSEAAPRTVCEGELLAPRRGPAGSHRGRMPAVEFLNTERIDDFLAATSSCHEGYTLTGEREAEN